MRRRVIGIMVVGLAWSATAFAQASPSDKFAWDQAAPSLAVAQAYGYALDLDGVVQPTRLTATCAGATSPYQCSAPIPAVTPSAHVARVRAVDTNGTAIVGPFSDPLSFTMRATPAKPGNLTITPGT